MKASCINFSIIIDQPQSYSSFQHGVDLKNFAYFSVDKANTEWTNLTNMLAK